MGVTWHFLGTDSGRYVKEEHQMVFADGLVVCFRVVEAEDFFAEFDEVVHAHLVDFGDLRHLQQVVGNEYFEQFIRILCQQLHHLMC